MINFRKLTAFEARDPYLISWNTAALEKTPGTDSARSSMTYLSIAAGATSLLAIRDTERCLQNRLFLKTRPQDL